MELHEIKEAGIYIGTITDKTKVNLMNKELITVIIEGSAPFLKLKDILNEKANSIGEDTLRGVNYDFVSFDDTIKQGVEESKVEKIKDAFKTQLEDPIIKLGFGEYPNGDTIKEGDKLIFGFINKGVKDEYTMLTLKEEHLVDYELCDGDKLNKSTIPMIKKKDSVITKTNGTS